ncbi:TPA: YebO family protein [Enterobacter ludwigii]|uniref:YebO family protein n=1 Tax=Enterobacter TaxID=547 RepID=UPI0015F39862|nr:MULTISPECIES: YebO family protein [Enterobacter]MBA7773997.1 YebO family protein [Enterobacter sp. RHBSTW-00974]MBA7779105.1 YebO family protein [Enterobacter sp. RHBSTW-00318]MBA7831764.1 YebO family protein [Enterobacter sp. RHBSTW-00340]MBA8038736.1 YebO family protein [Enterobacter sp. RHBSTW-00131]MBG0585863.1 YebO family protein [Enterobacter ludwigii]
MDELLNSGLLNMASLMISLVVLLVGLVIWFFVNRASSRTNEQIELLEALLDQQKRQNALLRRLCEANEPEEKASVKDAVAEDNTDQDDFIRLVAER